MELEAFKGGFFKKIRMKKTVCSADCLMEMEQVQPTCNNGKNSMELTDEVTEHNAGDSICCLIRLDKVNLELEACKGGFLKKIRMKKTAYRADCIMEMEQVHPTCNNGKNYTELTDEVTEHNTGDSICFFN